jgi:hypothetical protein
VVDADDVGYAFEINVEAVTGGATEWARSWALELATAWRIIEPPAVVRGQMRLD